MWSLPLCASLDLANGLGPRVREGCAISPGDDLLVRAEGVFQDGVEGLTGRFKTDDGKLGLAVAKDGMLVCELRPQVLDFFRDQSTVPILRDFRLPGSGELKIDLTARLLPKEDIRRTGSQLQESLGAVNARAQFVTASCVQTFGMERPRVAEDQGFDVVGGRRLSVETELFGQTRPV